jgi:hypothetical protein
MAIRSEAETGVELAFAGYREQYGGSRAVVEADGET